MKSVTKRSLVLAATILLAVASLTGQAPAPATTAAPAATTTATTATTAAAPPAKAKLKPFELGKLTERYLKGDEAEKQKVLLEMADRDSLDSSGQVAGAVSEVLEAARKQPPRLRPVPTNTLAKLEEAAKTDPGVKGNLSAARVTGGGMQPVATVTTSLGDMRVMVFAAAGRKMPVVIYLHGGGRIATDNESTWNWGIMRSKKMTCAPFRLVPRCIDDASAAGWSVPSAALGLQAVLDGLRRSYDIDPDRIYLMGNSMGAAGIWYQAAVQGDSFAAVASLGGACGIQNGFENLRNLDFGIFMGSEDGIAATSRTGRDKLLALHEKDKAGYRLSFNEYPGMGHNIEDKVYVAVDKFFATHARQAYPRVVAWSPLFEGKKRFYNLGMAAPKAGMTVRAEMKADNTVEVTSQGVPALTVFLGEKLVDFKKPVKVTWNGKEVFNDKVVQRAGVILETLADRADPGMYYTAKVELKQ